MELTLVLITHLQFWHTQNRICFWKINLKKFFDQKLGKHLLQVEASASMHFWLFWFLARTTRQLGPFAINRCRFFYRTLLVRSAFTVDRWLGVFCTIFCHGIKHLFSQSASHWTFSIFILPIWAELVPFAIRRQWKSFVILTT